MKINYDIKYSNNSIIIPPKIETDPIYYNLNLHNYHNYHHFLQNIAKKKRSKIRTCRYFKGINRDFTGCWFYS